jgi:translin
MPVDEETLKNIIDQATDELQAREKARDEALARARKARQLSKKAILLDHNNQPDKAQANIAEARRLLDESQSHIQAHPELDQYEEVEAAHEEHAEATILHALLKTDTYPTPEQAAATPTRYLLGLGDVPGELRREALDALRTGDLQQAEKHLTRMEQIYLHLVAMEDASLLKGLRRKLDITRGVIEATRSEVTAETGRKRLSDQLKKLTEKPASKREHGTKP